MAAAWFDDEEFEPIGMMRITTESSIWLVTAVRYQRLPREERPRPPVRSIDGRLADNEWHDFRQCWWRLHSDGRRQLRLLPQVGPIDGVGVVSGIVEVVEGEWAPTTTTTGNPGPSVDD
jgi:hypothetical protein